MKLEQQYLQLHHRYGHAARNEVTLAELAELLDCTHRSTLTIVKKMAAAGWIDWASRRGRGQRSTLTLLAPAEQIASQYMLQAMNRRDVKQAAEQIGTFVDSGLLQEQLNQWLLGYLGHHTEAGSNNQPIDTLRLPLRQQLHALDPLYINLLAESFVTSHIFDGLVQRGEQGEISPCLAHTWDVSADRTTWTFYLRKGITFHHGRTFGASDVVFTFERLKRTERRTLYRDVSRQIQTIDALDPLTVRFKLHTAHELFLPFLSTSRAAIVPSGQFPLDAETAADDPTAMSIPIGTGPFKVTRWDRHVCMLEAFPSYFQGRAHLDRVEILQIPWSSRHELAEHHNEETPFFHLVHNPSNPSGNEWSQVGAGVTVHKLMTCNTQKTGPLRDPAVRARVYACLTGVLSERNDIQTASSSASHKFMDELPSAKDAADGSAPLLVIATIPQYRQNAAIIAEKLQQHGFNCTVRSAPMEQFKGELRLESDLILFSLIRDRDEELRRYDLYLTLSEHLHDTAKHVIQNMLRFVMTSPEGDERMSVLDKIEEELAKEHLLITLSEKPMETAYLPSVRGLSFNSQGWVNLRHIWFPSTSTQG